MASSPPPAKAPAPGAAPGEAPQKSSKSFDLINRGTKRSNPVGTTTFVGLRALDPLLQYGVLAHGIGSGLLHKVGLETLPAGSPNTGTFLDALGLSPYRLVLLGMAVGSSVKQIYWLLACSQEEFPPGAAVAVGAYNTIFNTVNNLIFTCAATSASLSGDGVFPQTPLLVGSALYVAGIVTETVSEIQRQRFKKDPKNAGKAYTGGLWSVARHINYTGYSFWRAGFSVAAGGWVWGSIVLAWLSADFTLRAIPVLDEYCEKRYGAQWAEFKRKTPYKFFPGLV